MDKECGVCKKYPISERPYTSCYCRNGIERNETDNGWKSIETAPKDGTVILVSAPTEVYGYVIGTSYFVPDFEGNWISAAISGGVYLNLANPTHWMPLPNPPQSEITRGGKG